MTHFVIADVISMSVSVALHAVPSLSWQNDVTSSSVLPLPEINSYSKRKSGNFTCTGV